LPDDGQAVRGLARGNAEPQLPVQAFVFQHGVGEVARYPSTEAFHFLVRGVRGGAADKVDGVRVAVALAEVGDGAEGEHALVHDSGSVCQGFGFFHGMGLEGRKVSASSWFMSPFGRLHSLLGRSTFRDLQLLLPAKWPASPLHRDLTTVEEQVVQEELRDDPPLTTAEK